VSPEDMQRFVIEVEAYGNELALTCRRCDWTSWPDEPITLAELVQRAGEHTEVCG
jgi:hypothetical protein